MSLLLFTTEISLNLRCRRFPNEYSIFRISQFQKSWGGETPPQYPPRYGPEGNKVSCVNLEIVHLLVDNI